LDARWNARAQLWAISMRGGRASPAGHDLAPSHRGTRASV